MEIYTEDDTNSGLKECTECGKNFLNVSNLRRHVRTAHPEKLQEIAPLFYKNKANFNFSCDICNKNFNLKSHLRHHMKKHNADDTSEDRLVKASKKCPLCSLTLFKAVDLIKHFEDEHNIVINSKDMEFTSFQDFEEWMKGVEKKTQSKFVKKGTRIFRHHKTTKYVCHRAGYYVPRGKGLRSLKIKGSSKIDGYCPASIKLTHYNNGLCYIHSIETHVGHDVNLQYLPLTKEDKQKIASLIANNVPFDDILNNFKNNSSQDSERIRLLSRKDLYNIQKSFNLSTNSVDQSIDEISLESWVRDLQEGDNCVMYKPQGITIEEYPLKNEDFLLIIMTPIQCELIKKYGNNCVCVDKTCINNEYYFNLHTLFVVDDVNESIPCTFCISNIVNEDVLKFLFWFIKEQVGTVATKIFVSDPDDIYFNCWKQIMGMPNERLFSRWHLDQDWKYHLKKVQSKDKQVNVCKDLKALLKEKDSSRFHEMLEDFCKILSTDPETSEFAKYFIDKYSTNFICWALSYGTNFITNLEKNHKIIKNSLLKGKYGNKLDKDISEIMNLFREKLLNALTIDEINRLFVKNIQEKHQESLVVEKNFINSLEDCWEISSETLGESYLVKEINQSCPCDVICSECTACIHQYQCSCVDSSIKFNICKHIHLLSSWRKQEIVNNVIKGDDYEENYFIQIEQPNKLDSKVLLIPKRSLEKEKEELKKQIYSLLDNIQTLEEFEIIKKALEPLLLRSSDEATKSNKTYENLDINGISEEYITYDPTSQPLQQLKQY